MSSTNRVSRFVGDDLRTFEHANFLLEKRVMFEKF